MAQAATKKTAPKTAAKPPVKTTGGPRSSPPANPGVPRDPLLCFKSPFKTTFTPYGGQPTEFTLPSIQQTHILPVLKAIRASMSPAERGQLTEQKLHEAFRQTTGAVPSSATFRKWLNDLGISFKRVRTVVGFEGEGSIETTSDEDDIETPEETTGDDDESNDE